MHSADDACKIEQIDHNVGKSFGGELFFDYGFAVFAQDLSVAAARL